MNAAAGILRADSVDAGALFEAHRLEVFRRTDRLFARLMFFQWAVAVLGAFLIAPRTWEGGAESVHPHVWAAVIIGTLASALPIHLALTRPGECITRHVIGVGQMLMSALLIDVTGGRIETHFHVFGSLAFLAFYRDWRVLVSASVVVAADHFLRGMYFPESVYGLVTASRWRWLEHAGWVVFEDVFLAASCIRGVREMREISERTADLSRERDRFEEAVEDRTKDLAESAMRFQSLSMSSPVGVFEADGTGRCTYVNPRWQEIAGLDLMASQGVSWFESVHPDDRAEITRRWEDSARTGHDWSMEFRIRTPAGEVRWVHSRARALCGDEGQVTGHVGTVEDVTERHVADDERKSLEDQLRQSQKMEAIGRLAGGIAHDFNNLLTAILGFGHMVKKRLGPSHPEIESVDQIIRAGDRAADLTRQLLAFGRRQVLQVALLDLRVIVGRMSPMLQRVIGEDIEFRTVAGPEIGMIRADGGQLEQVIMNLVVNARDAMPGGGKLTIETAPAELDATYAADHPEVRPGHYVMLSVSDTGIGMDDEVRSHLFEPFFTTKELGRGTGLGLATVYGIVRQSDGYVAVYSEPGVGTTFKVYLPRVEAGTPEDSQSVDDCLPPPRGDETILLAEDEPGVLSLARSVLRELGYKVVSGSSGAAALAAAGAHAGMIHLVVTDVVMPGMGGRELAKRLVVARPGVKTLYMSGYTDDAIVRHGILHQEAVFLQKPFTPAMLARKVRLVLDRELAAAARVP